MTKFNISLSQAFMNKEPINDLTKQQAFGTPTPATLVTPQELFDHITSGKTFVVGTYEGDAKSKENFIQSQTLWLDLDDNISIADCLEVPFIRDNAFMLYSSGTSSHEHYKTRVGFQLDKPITDSFQYERMVLALFEACNPLISDDACKDSSRLFYGSTNTTEPPILKPDKITLLQVLEIIADDLDIIDLERTEAMNEIIRANNTRRMASHSTALEAYANKALNNMVAELSSMSEGGRNNTAFKFGASMGNMVAANMIDAVTAESALIHAALASGLSQFEALAVSRGMARGLETPFDTNKLKDSNTQAKPKRPPQNIIKLEQPKEKRTHTQIIDDEIMAKTMAYDAGQRMSWVNQDDLPVSLLSVVLTLAGGREILPLVFAKMHQLLKLGDLHPIFSISDISNALDIRRATIAKIIKTLSDWGFVHFLATRTTKELVNQESVQNYSQGRPIGLWTISKDWQVCLSDAIKTYQLEKHTRRAISTKVDKMIFDLGLSQDDFKVFQSRAKLAQGEKWNAEANKAYQKEMRGDGHNWNGWIKALESDYSFPRDKNNKTRPAIDWRDIPNMKRMRIAILKQWIDHVRPQNTVEELERILGCSGTTIDDICRVGHIDRQKQTERIEFKPPKTAHGLRSEFNRLQREKRGKCWKIAFHEKGETSWSHMTEHSYLAHFATFAHKIDNVFMILTLPSVQRVMTDSEILALTSSRLMQVKFLAAVITAVCKDLDIASEITPIASVVSVSTSTPRNTVKSPVMSDSHNWLEHSYKWLFTQVRLHFHSFTECELYTNLYLVEPYDGIGCAELKVTFIDLEDAVLYLNKHASDKVKRDTSLFYGKDYSEKDDIDELEQMIEDRAPVEKQARYIDIQASKQPELKATKTNDVMSVNNPNHKWYKYSKQGHIDRQNKRIAQ